MSTSPISGPKDPLADPKGQEGVISKLDEELAGKHKLLAEDLAQIGAKWKSIGPEILSKYPRVLSCPAVECQLRPDATLSEIAEIAHKTLKEAIASLDEGPERTVGEVLLAVGTWEGKSVTARKADLIDYPGCSDTTYKRYRPRVLCQIVDYLFSTKPNSRSGLNGGHSRKLIPAEHETAIEQLGDLFEDALNLYIVFLAFLFIRSEEEGMRLSGTKPADPTAIGELLHESYMNFILSSGLCLAESDWSRREAVENYLPAEVLATLEDIERQIQLPSKLREHKEDARRAYFEDTAQLGKYRFASSEIRSEIVRQIGDRPPCFTRIETQIETTADHCLNIMLILDAYVENIIGAVDSVEDSDNVECSDFESQAVRAAARYLGQSSKTPTKDGGNLRNDCTYYIRVHLAYVESLFWDQRKHSV